MIILGVILRKREWMEVPAFAQADQEKHSGIAQPGQVIKARACETERKVLIYNSMSTRLNAGPQASLISP